MPMDSIEKKEQQKEDTRRISKGNNHSIDRQICRKSRDKGQNRKPEKSISRQKSPFKSKHHGDKQFTRTAFGHSGLSSKNFSRYQMQDNGTKFYAKSVKLGKITTELKKKPININLSGEKGKLSKHSTVRGSCDEQHPEGELPNISVSSTSSIHSSSMDKSNNRSLDNNPPRHRKCYTNSKHAEYTKIMKFGDKGQDREMKITQSVSDLKYNGGSSGDELNHPSSDDVHRHVNKDNNSITDKDFYPKSYLARNKALAGSENTFDKEPDTALSNTTLLTPSRSENKFPNSSPKVTSLKFCMNMENNQSKSSTYFYRGTDNKMNLEASDISGVKILLRGDLLGALNCLFPQLNLVASENNPKRPLLDPQFSYFSDSSEVLIETFAKARIFFNEQRKTSTQDSKKFELGGFMKDDLDDRSLQKAEKDSVSFIEISVRSSHLDVRNILSAKEVNSSSKKDLQTPNISTGSNQQNIIKFTQSETGIIGIGSRSTKINERINRFDDLRRTTTTPSEDYTKISRNFENMLKSVQATCDENRRADETSKNYNKKCLYSSVLKNSLYNKHLYIEEKSLSHYKEVVNLSENLSNINNNSTEKSNDEVMKSVENLMLSVPEPEENRPMKKNLTPVLQPKIHYDLNELERDIIASLEKILDESDDPGVLGQYIMQSPNTSATFDTFAKNGLLPNVQSNQDKKYNENCYRQPLAGTSGSNSLQSRLNFLRTKGRTSDFEQFFNPLTFNTQLAAQFIKQDNIGNTLNPVQLDHYMNPKSDLYNFCASNLPYYQPNPANPFEKDIKELLIRYPQIMHNPFTSAMNHHHFLTTGNANIAASTPLDFSSLYSHLAATKTHLSQLSQSLAKTSCTDENIVLNQFIASQNLDNIYSNPNLSRCNMAGQKIPNQVSSDFNKQSPFGITPTGIIDRNSFLSPSYLNTNNCLGSPTSGIRTIISVSDLEKQALEQYRNSEESINARYDVLEKEAEEQYNCLSQK